VGYHHAHDALGDGEGRHSNTLAGQTSGVVEVRRDSNRPVPDRQTGVVLGVDAVTRVVGYDTPVERATTPNRCLEE